MKEWVGILIVTVLLFGGAVSALEYMDRDYEAAKAHLEELQRLYEQAESCSEQCPPGCWCQPLPDFTVGD